MVNDPAGPALPDLGHHGDREVGPGLLDLAVNVRRSAPPPWLAEIIAATIGDLGAYPDPAPARTALAAAHDVDPAMVLPTAGGAEAFTLLARAYPAAPAAVVHPQFTEPETALRAVGNRPTWVLTDPADGFALHPEQVPTDADLVFVGNPTNPTAVRHPAATLHRLLRPGRILVVDEAFLDAVPLTATGTEADTMIAPDMPGLVVLRSLTKTWGLAGLRAGYAVGDPAVIAAMAAQQPNWSVSTPAIAAMIATADPGPRAEAADEAMVLQQYRDYLDSGLRGLGLAPVPGVAPFVLVEVGPGVREALRAAGFAVRRGDTFPGLGPQWIRIAVREPHLTDALLGALGPLLHRGPHPGTPGPKD
ncbi:Rv2231c family pyridoxal phosphate-dependent protein CobC [Granulicoccus phenolivorans]|uniref:Rv2231c family pyridoxal phosphate-dependent protein CobC n=1 Tax=Granulicoccus phenolivorans TaxID=266854 RepID=UPI000419597C|nr:Rv2231c family pyridoxal phosphate-dependent protein CobC [Granulicoccus phenolivorans]